MQGQTHPVRIGETGARAPERGPEHVGAGGFEQRTAQLVQGGAGEAGLVLHAGGAEDERAARRVCGGPVQQGRLADARLAGQDEGAAVTVAQRADEAGQLAALPFPADQFGMSLRGRTE